MILLVSGCVNLTVVQDLDLTSNNKLTISAEVTGDSAIREVNSAINEIKCKFDAEETIKEGTSYLSYTSQNCLLDGVQIKKLTKNKYKYTLDSFSFEKFSSSITDATYIVRMKGTIIDTNGISIGNDQVKFLISSDDIKNRRVYYVEYNLYCSTDSECSVDEYCANSECVKLNCGYCEYIENHQCKSYACCSDEDCKESQKCKNHNCLNIACAENEGFFNHSCRLLECKDNEFIKSNKCELLNCNFFQKPVNHKCITNPTTIILAIVILMLIAGSSIAIYFKIKQKKKKK